MGRRKLLSDDALLDRVLETIEVVGPANLTFTKAATAAGLSPATLVQRFGTRDRMIETTLLHAWDKLDIATAATDASLPVTPDGAIALLLALTPGGTTMHDVGNGLLLLREDFRNPVLRARGAAWGSTLAGALGRRLAEDADAAERLGWQMARIWQGEILWSAFRRQSEPGRAIELALQEWCRSVGVLAS